MHPLSRLLPLALLFAASTRLPASSDPACDDCLTSVPGARAFHGGGGARTADGDRIHAHTILLSHGGVASSSDGRIVSRQGATGMVYHATAFSVTAEPTVLNETGSEPVSTTRTTLTGHAVFDDGTTAPLLGNAIRWDAPVPGGALESISSDGLATAATVPEDTEVTYFGRYGGLLSSGSLWVVNTLPDNHGVWAGDGFDDQWQIDNGIPGALDPDAVVNGMPTWMHYAFGRNPLAPGGGALVAITNPETGGTILEYTRNPLASDFTFTPEVAANSLDDFSPTSNYIEIATPEARDAERVEIHFPPPPSGTRSQFFRLRVDRME